MLTPDVTPPLDEFLARAEHDDNEWWRLACGHHLNLFEEAVSRMQAAERRLASEPDQRANVARVTADAIRTASQSAEETS